MHCSVRKWGTNSRVHSISGGDHQNIGPVDGTDQYEASMLKILLNMLVGAQFSFAWVLWRNINLEKWILWVHCKIANIFRIKLQSFPCARFVLNRGLCWGEMLRNLHVLPQFVSFIWFLKTLQISIYLPRVDQNVLVRDRSNQWASKIQFQCQATAALFVGCWSKDSFSYASRFNFFLKSKNKCCTF